MPSLAESTPLAAKNRRTIAKFRCHASLSSLSSVLGALSPFLMARVALPLIYAAIAAIGSLIVWDATDPSCTEQCEWRGGGTASCCGATLLLTIAARPFVVLHAALVALYAIVLNYGVESAAPVLRTAAAFHVICSAMLQYLLTSPGSAVRLTCGDNCVMNAGAAWFGVMITLVTTIVLFCGVCYQENSTSCICCMSGSGKAASRSALSWGTLQASPAVADRH